MTFDDFTKQAELGFSFERRDSNPNMDGPMSPTATHWLCTLSRRDQFIEVPFSMGCPEMGEPTLGMVLGCLRMDAFSILVDSFEEWAAEFGYDEDSRQAERTFNACQQLSNDLRDLLGEELFELLLSDQMEEE